MANRQVNLDITLSNGQKAGKTINELRQQTNRLTKEVNNLKPGTEEFIKKSGDLKKVGDRLGEVRKEAKGVEEATNGILATFQQFIPFNGQLAAMKGNILNVAGSFKTLRGAMIATGIGAFIVILGTLISYLTTVQAGMDKVTAVTRPLLAVFQTLKGVVQELGGSIFKGLAMILNGDIKEGLKVIGNGFVEVVDNTKKAIDTGLEAGAQLDKLQKQIEQTEIDLTVRRAELNTKYNESKEIAQDLSKSEQVRVKAAQEAIAAQDELLTREQDFINLKIEKMKLEHSLNDTSREDQLELARLEAERIEFEATAAKKRASARSLENTARKTQNAEELKAIKDREKAELESIKKLEEAAALARVNRLNAEKNLQDLRIASMQEGIDKEIEQIWLDTERKIEALTGTDEQIRAQQILLEDLRLAAIEEVRDKYRDKQLAKDKKLADEQQAIAEQKAAFDRDMANLQQEMAADVTSFLAGELATRLGDERAAKAIQKSAAVAEIGFNLVQELSANALTAAANPLNAVTFGAAGAAQLKLLNTASVLRAALGTAKALSFEKGGLLQGPRHSQGGIPAIVGGRQPIEMEGGEFVFSRKATAGIGADVLAGINRKFEFGGPVSNLPDSSSLRRREATAAISPSSSQSNELLAAFMTYAQKVDQWQRELTVNSNLQDVKKGIETLNKLENDASV